MSRRTSGLVCILLALCLALALLPGTALAADSPEKSSNRAKQNYSTYHASTVTSYLYENEDGGLTRVEYIDGKIVVEDYDSSFRYLSGQTVPMELDIWGGFFPGESFNFLVFGQMNTEEDNNKEVIRVVKYSKDWDRLGQASLYGANTETPFLAGSLRAAEYGGELYIRTCHRMYTSSDGLNHQANLTMAVRESDMALLDSYSKVANYTVGYVSHSFNQFVIIDQQQRIVTLDHGDAYPRSAVLMVYGTKAEQGKFSGSVSNVTIQNFPGATGDNATGASLGGLAETNGGYAVAYNYNGTGKDSSFVGGLFYIIDGKFGKFDSSSSDRSVYFAYVDKNGLEVTTTKISDAGSLTPVLAPTSLDGGYILWNVNATDDTLYYASYSDGGGVGAVKTATASLSDCQPILYNGKLVWYTTDNTTPTFYQLDESGVTAVSTADGHGGDTVFPVSGGISVTVGGVAVVWTDAAPFIDANSRTMVPLRAVADAMGLTVNWDAAAREASFTDGAKTIYFPIGSTTARTSGGGTVQMDTAAVIASDRTYAPIRYLAEYFGYTVDWDAAARTVIITA